MTKPPRCAERHQLAEEFATAARVYAETVVEWVRSETQGDYNRLRSIAEDAQARAIKTALLFEAHIDSHQCCDGPLNVRSIAALRRRG